MISRNAYVGVGVEERYAGVGVGAVPNDVAEGPDFLYRTTFGSVFKHRPQRFEVGVYVGNDSYAHKANIGRRTLQTRNGERKGRPYNRAVLVSEIGEFGLIQRLAGEFGLTYPPSRDSKQSGLHVGLGDDAVVTPLREGSLIWTTDTMVDGVHFLPDKISWRDVGWKALATNLSDTGVSLHGVRSPVIRRPTVERRAIALKNYLPRMRALEA